MSLCLKEKGTEEFIEEASPKDVLQKISELKNKLKNDILILGHHYQNDDIIAFADKTGDSFELSRYAAECKEKKYIIFCGVHFMAETADILVSEEQKVILPDLAAGCSMADMADLANVEIVFDAIQKMTGKKLLPITYMNSTADIKSFVGEKGGAVCTSSNSEAILNWAFKKYEQVLFIPDQHLGRNTAFKMGIPLEKMIVEYNPKEISEMDVKVLKNIKMFLWKGHCSVHMNFRPEHVDSMRKLYPDVKIIVHPECVFSVVQKADFIGSTSNIIKTIDQSPDRTRWAVGTEHHLVNRLSKKYKNKIITTLAPFTCQCSTMYRITPESLLKSLESLNKGSIENVIQVDSDIKHFSRLALERMLEIH